MTQKKISEEFTVGNAVTQLNAAGSSFSDSTLQDAQVLTAYILDKPRTWVMAHPEKSLNLEQVHLFEICKQKLELGTPLPYILGEWEFFGRKFHISPAVLIPRPETELLVEEALVWLKSHSNSRTAAETGTGSGIISISLALEFEDLKITATDISPEALIIAEKNAVRHQTASQITFTKNDLLQGIAGPFDLIAANLPYIPTETLKLLQVSKQEPHLALDGGADGLDLIRKLLAYASDSLASPGLALLEIEYRQGYAVQKIAKGCFPKAKISLLKDLAGQDRLLRIEKFLPTKA